MFPLTDGEIPKDFLEFLYERFKGEIPMATREKSKLMKKLPNLEMKL